MTPLFRETNTAASQEKVPFQLARSLWCILNQVQVLSMNKHEQMRRILKSKRTAAEEAKCPQEKSKQTAAKALEKRLEAHCFNLGFVVHASAV